MGRRNKNTFSKALGHLKSRKIDEKIQMLSERPANSTLGYMTAVGAQSNPNFISTQQGQESALAEVRPDFTVDGPDDQTGYDGKDTTGLFKEDGTPRTAMPPGDTSYILGPMSAMWYAWANQTRIGYIRQSDRKMQNLGYITGKLSDWDGSSGVFYSYGQLTLDQANWFRTIQKQPGATNDPSTYNYRAFYPGPPSTSRDAFGRYYCVVTGEPLGDPLPGVGEKEVNPGEGGPQDPDSIFSAIMDRLRTGMRLSKAEREFLKKRLPPRTSIRGNRLEKEAYAMPPDKFKEKYGLNPEDVIDYYRNQQGSQSQSLDSQPAKENNAISNLLDTMAKNIKSNTQGMGDKLKDNFKKVLEQGKNFYKDIFDANNAADYNAKLAINLGLSILSGKKIDIPLSDSAKKDLINNIDADALKDVLKINDSTPTNADEAINPSGNKSDKVVKGPWGAQGGLDFNYNEKTGELEIVSNKTLRTDSGGETTIKDKRGSNFEVDKLTDIPDASKESVQDMSTKIISDISTKLGGPGLDPNIPNYSVQQQLDDISQQYDDNAITSAVTEIASDIITQGTQGTAQNIIALRAALKNLSIKSSTDSNAWKPFSQDSDIEKIGGAAGHVTSTTTVKFDDLPADIKEVILDKLENKNVKESISESRKIQILKNLKQPIVIPETKQKSYKVRVGRKNKECKTNFQGMDKLIGTVKPQQSFKPRDIWSHGWQEYNARSSQDKKNTVLEKIGDGKYAWDYMINQGTMMNAKNLEEFWGKNPDFYSYFFNGKKYRPIRKEQVKGDFIVFLIDEFGNKSSMLQSELNLKLVEDYEKKMLAEYNELYDIESTYKKDPLFKRVSNRLSKEIDYPDKPSKKGYPDKPPLEVDPNTGMHPRYGKLSDRYKKLDPMSANAMPPTGEPEIDSVVDKQRTQSKNHLDFTKIKSLRKKG